MDGTPRDQVDPDRPFDWSRFPLTDSAKRFTAEVVQLVADFESRQRARRAEDQARHVAAVSTLSLDLIHRHMTCPKGWISVSLDKAMYRPNTRNAPFLTEEFPKLVTFMASHGLVDLRKGEQGAFGTGRRTTIRAGTWLLERMEALEVFLGDISRNTKMRKDALVIRGPKVRGQNRNLPVPVTKETLRLRAEIDSINEWIASADLSWLGDEEEDRVDLGDRFLKRIYNNGSLELGGRLYGGFWQRISHERRVDFILFGQHGAASLDFGQMAIRSAYAMANKVPPAGDLYEIPGFERHRDSVKRLLNALLAAEQVPQRFPLGSRGSIPKRHSYWSVLEAIQRHHQPIQHLFGTGLALRLMHLESNILVTILLRLKEVGIVALPVHDGLLVSDADRSIAREVMVSVFLEELGSEPTIGESLSTVSYTPTVESSVPLKKGA